LTRWFSNDYVALEDWIIQSKTNHVLISTYFVQSKNLFETKVCDNEIIIVKLHAKTQEQAEKVHKKAVDLFSEITPELGWVWVDKK
jgi:hypothetical protein